MGVRVLKGEGTMWVMADLGEVTSHTLSLFFAFPHRVLSPLPRLVFIVLVSKHPTPRDTLKRVLFSLDLPLLTIALQHCRRWLTLSSQISCLALLIGPLISPHLIVLTLGNQQCSTLSHVCLPLRDVRFLPVANTSRLVAPKQLFVRLPKNLSPIAYECETSLMPHLKLLRSLGVREAPDAQVRLL